MIHNCCSHLARAMKHLGLLNWLSLLHLILLAQLLTVTALCPSPFQIEASRCVYVEKSDNFTWCEANQQCKAIGGELMNEYESLKVLDQMPSVSGSRSRLWFGLSDLADERDKRRGGWQRINDKGNLPEESFFWYSGMPSSHGNQDCLASSEFTALFIDNECSNRRGFICEFVVPETPQAADFCKVKWQQTEFKRTSYNPSGKYCFKDVPVDSLAQCLMAATTDGSARRVLFNTKTKECRLLQFTDAQVDEWIETGANWVKLSI